MDYDPPNYNPPKTPKRIPPDIWPKIPDDPMQLTIPTINKGKGKEKAAVNQAIQSNSNDSTHYHLMQRWLYTELQSEKDKDILIILQKQLESLKAIAEFKNSGKRDKLEAILLKQVESKNSSKTTGNEVISQLQNQVENLEKSVENKFNLILKSIETTSQKQSQNQAQNQSPNQSLNVVKTYA